MLSVTFATLRKHQPVLGAFGYMLAFTALFGGTALAAHHSRMPALLGGAAAILFAKLYVKVVAAVQRWIDALHARKPDEAVRPDGISVWAIVVYGALGLALAFALTAVGSRASRITAVTEFLIAWAAGCFTLNYLWRRRADPESPTALDIIDDWLDAQSAPHWPALSRAGYVLSFVLLCGGVALHAFQSGLALTAVAQCGSACAVPGVVYLAAALCGVAAILFVMIYAAITETTQLVFVDSWKHVRPGPPPQELKRWAGVLLVLIGPAVFLAMAAFGAGGVADEQAPGDTYVTLYGPRGALRAALGGYALLELMLGWWIGGLVVLKFFWLRRRATR